LSSEVSLHTKLQGGEGSKMNWVSSKIKTI